MKCLLASMYSTNNLRAKPSLLSASMSELCSPVRLLSFLHYYYYYYFWMLLLPNAEEQHRYAIEFFPVLQFATESIKSTGNSTHRTKLYPFNNTATVLKQPQANKCLDFWLSKQQTREYIHLHCVAVSCADIAVISVVVGWMESERAHIRLANRLFFIYIHANKLHAMNKWFGDDDEEVRITTTAMMMKMMMVKNQIRCTQTHSMSMSMLLLLLLFLPFLLLRVCLPFLCFLLLVCRLRSFR